MPRSMKYCVRLNTTPARINRRADHLIEIAGERSV